MICSSGINRNRIPHFFNLFNSNLKHNLASLPCHVLFMFMFAYLDIINLRFHICLAHFMFLFIVLMFLFSSHIILSCFLFEN
jgi:hypothetical protein